MGDAYRVATKVPWENHVRDWSGKFNTIDGALAEVRDRADHHRGKLFDERRYGHEPFGNDRPLSDTMTAARHDLVQGPFGEIVQVRALEDNVQWWVKKLKDKDDPINLPEANVHIDWLYTYVFRDHRSSYPTVENWGTCNRRFIDGTTEWSEHSPWNAPDPGCNAIDFHASYDVMFHLSRDLAGGPHAAKLLFYRMEWTKATGWINAPSIGTSHDDHVHVEGPRDHGSLAAACHY
jgi:hypothetical protein